MKFLIHSHCRGEELVASTLQNEVAVAIESINVKITSGAAARIRDAFLSALKAHGWSGEVLISPDSDMTITSGKSEVGLCLQTGNVARVYADLIKLQSLYLDNAIKGSIIIVPSQPIALKLGSNIAQATRLIRELSIFQKAYNVPTLLFSLE
jgi:hypothetical protein